MEENNNKPIGLRSKDLHMEDSRSAFRDVLGHMADRFRLKKIPYGAWRSETRSAPALGGPFIWFEAHMGLRALVRPHLPRRMFVGGGHFWENVCEWETRGFFEKNYENT